MHRLRADVDRHTGERHGVDLAPGPVRRLEHDSGHSQLAEAPGRRQPRDAGPDDDGAASCRVRRHTPQPKVGFVSDTDVPDLDPDATSYYRRIDANTFQPTLHVQGAWKSHEQHMAPVGGLLTHCITRYEPRASMQLARVTFEILGVIHAVPTTVEVRTIRPGRTIELIEATAFAGGRPVVRASAWLLAREDTSEVCDGMPAPMPPIDEGESWRASERWLGGYIASIEALRYPHNEPGHGHAWIPHAPHPRRGRARSPLAAYVGLVDTANGMNVRLRPQEWAFPNIDLTIHLYRTPHGGPGCWVGFDTYVTIGADGVGLTTTTLHDESGPVGRAEQILTVRRMT